MEIRKFVTTPKGKRGYILETKMDKVKVQLVDGLDLPYGQRTDWFEKDELKYEDLVQ